MTWGVTDLSVSFGTRRALERVTLTVQPGGVTAVVGGDGAGKSTLLGVLAGLPIPHAGIVERPPAARLGYVPGSSGVFPDLTVTENVEFIAAAFRVEDRGARSAGLLNRTGLAPFADRLAGTLSGGQRQKLALVMGLLHSPDLLILDEPTTGLDPVSRVEIWRMIGAASVAGAAVVISTSYLDEAERAARILVLHEGRAVLSGTAVEVTGSVPGTVVESDHPGDPARSWRRGAGWREWKPEGSQAGAVAPDLEDAVIVATLATGKDR